LTAHPSTPEVLNAADRPPDLNQSWMTDFPSGLLECPARTSAGAPSTFARREYEPNLRTNIGPRRPSPAAKRNLNSVHSTFNVGHFIIHGGDAASSFALRHELLRNNETHEMSESAPIGTEVQL
jgi:hypothetical protein